MVGGGVGRVGDGFSGGCGGSRVGLEYCMSSD